MSISRAKVAAPFDRYYGNKINDNLLSFCDILFIISSEVRVWNGRIKKRKSLHN